MAGELTPGGAGEFEIYQARDGRTCVQVHVENETVWRTERQMGELFKKDVHTGSEDFGNIFDEAELQPGPAIRNFRTTAIDGSHYATQQNGLDVILSVGYRGNKAKGEAGNLDIMVNAQLKAWVHAG